MKKKHFSVLLLLIGIYSTYSCKNEKKQEIRENVSKTVKSDFNPEEHLKKNSFDTLIDGKQVSLYWLEVDSIKAAFTNYGGRLVGLWVPDENGNYTDVVVGMDNIKSYMESSEPYFGATIGRVGNRIAKGKFTLNGKEYDIPQNNNGNTLHGGKKGFQDVVWDAEKTNDSTLVLKYKSSHMEEGFPGNLDVTVTYSLTSEPSVKMEYKATTDKATPVNLTNHAFFNLNGEGSGSILNHKVRFYADKFTPVDRGLIPIGEYRNVEGTPFDFTEFHRIGERIETENEQLKNGGGYDHNFILNGKSTNGMNHAATVIGEKSGIRLDVYTEEPGIQFYSGNFMEGKNEFKSGARDEFRTAFALETQHFPDAPNQPDFPQITLNQGDTYHTVSEYEFSIEETKSTFKK